MIHPVPPHSLISSTRDTNMQAVQIIELGKPLQLREVALP